MINYNAIAAEAAAVSAVSAAAPPAAATNLPKAAFRPFRPAGRVGPEIKASAAAIAKFTADAAAAGKAPDNNDDEDSESDGAGGAAGEADEIKMEGPIFKEAQELKEAVQDFFSKLRSKVKYFSDKNGTLTSRTFKGKASIVTAAADKTSMVQELTVSLYDERDNNALKSITRIAEYGRVNKT